jgi:hypothetical protein
MALFKAIITNHIKYSNIILVVVFALCITSVILPRFSEKKDETFNGFSVITSMLALHVPIRMFSNMEKFASNDRVRFMSLAACMCTVFDFVIGITYYIMLALTISIYNSLDEKLSEYKKTIIIIGVVAAFNLYLMLVTLVFTILVLRKPVQHQELPNVG